MAWPFKKEEPLVDPEKKPETPETKQNEKSVSEIIAESLKPTLDGLAARLQAIEEATKPRETPKPREPQTIPSVLDDEDAAFNTRMGPILQSNLELEAKMTRNEVKQEYIDAGLGDAWRSYEADIDRTLTDTALVAPDGKGGVKKLRGDAQYVRNVVDMIIGRALRSDGVKFNSDKKKFFLENASSPDSSKSTETPKLEGLTEKQAKLAQRLGIPLDKMKATVAKLDFVQ